jgi:hypothetical protein
MSKGPENRFLARLGKGLKSHWGSTVWVHKNHGGLFSSGIPDLVIQATGEGTVWLEAKYGHKGVIEIDKVTPIQCATMEEMARAGARCMVLWACEHPSLGIVSFTWSIHDWLQLRASSPVKRFVAAPSGVPLPRGAISCVWGKRGYPEDVELLRAVWGR